MSRALLVGALLSLSLTVGCANSGQYMVAYAPRVDWPTHEYEQIRAQVGDSVVTGQAFLKNRGGDVKTAAGNKVMLNPVSAYSKQFVDVVIYRRAGLGVQLKPSTPDARMDEFLATTTADADGRFSFYDVSDGEYYLYTWVTWEVPSRLRQDPPKTQGGWVFKKVHVSSSRRNEFILNGLE
jgi:hypothetical protein